MPPEQTLKQRELGQTFQSGGGISEEEARNLNRIASQDFVDQDAIQISRMRNRDGSINAEDISFGGTVSTPTETVSTEQQTFQSGLASSVEKARTNLDDTLKTQRDEALKRVEKNQEELKRLQKETDPRERDTFEQEKRITQSQLDAAETAASTLEEDFVARRKTVSELEKLLTQGNELIKQKQSAPVSQQILNKSVNKSIQDVQARAGVLEAVLSGLDGNISQAHTLIGNARNAVDAQWRDVKAYQQSYMALVESGQLKKDKILTSYSQGQIALAEKELQRSEATEDYLKELMIDPTSAQFIADAGITLNDSVEEINNKMQKQTQREEIKDVTNDLVFEGYERVPFGENRDDVVSLEVGGETLYFKPPIEEISDPQGTVPPGPGTVPVDPDTGELIDYTTVEGIKRAAELGEPKVDVRRWLDQNAKGLQKSTIDALIGSAVWAEDTRDQEIIKENLNSIAKEEVERVFDKRFFRGEDKELEQAKKDAMQVISDSRYKESQKRYLISQIENMTLNDIEID